jgi:hypothetical protein
MTEGKKKMQQQTGGKERRQVGLHMNVWAQRAQITNGSHGQKLRPTDPVEALKPS